MKNIIETLKENKALFGGMISAAIFVVIAVSVFIVRYGGIIGEDNLLLRKSSFEKVEGWKIDNQLRTIDAFKNSCARILKKDSAMEFGVGGFAGLTKDWQDICTKLEVEDFKSISEARKFFENNFNVYELWGANGRKGLFTGYYEPTLKGSLTKTEKYNIPIYSRPDSMINADLGLFSEDLKGKTITGRVEGKNFIPYYKRFDIEQGSLADENIEIVWVDNPVDAFFLHIQGSGRVELESGEVLRVGYSAQNGYAYTAIGKKLVDTGAIKKEKVSMQSIRKWLEENPDKAADIMNVNESYVFFKILDIQGEGPLGAEGVSLTPKRSLAVDRKKIPYGVPVWIDAEMPSEEILEEENSTRIRSLLVAQDTGGAIKGVVRGDFFWGAGADAAYNAGLMKSKGKAWLLLPKTVEVDKSKLKKTIFNW